MAKATTKTVVKYMTDKEKKLFVDRQIHNFLGFIDDDNKSYIEFKNGNGRIVEVKVSLYNEAIGLKATERGTDRNVYFKLNFLTKEDSNLWYYVNQKNRRLLVERSTQFFDIIVNGCIKVLEKFDEKYTEKFLVLYGSLSDSGKFIKAGQPLLL